MTDIGMLRRGAFVAFLVVGAAFVLLADPAGAQDAEVTSPNAQESVSPAPGADTGSLAVTGEAQGINRAVFAGQAESGQAISPEQEPVAPEELELDPQEATTAEAIVAEPTNEASAAEPLPARRVTERKVRVSVVVDGRPASVAEEVHVSAPVGASEVVPPDPAPRRFDASVDPFDAEWRSAPGVVVSVRARTARRALELYADAMADLPDGVDVEGAGHDYVLIGPDGVRASGSAEGRSAFLVEFLASAAGVAGGPDRVRDPTEIAAPDDVPLLYASGDPHPAAVWAPLAVDRCPALPAAARTCSDADAEPPGPPTL